MLDFIKQLGILEEDEIIIDIKTTETNIIITTNIRIIEL